MRRLRRFREAQDEVYADVAAELTAGEKRTHWMWFVFPQAKGLGSSKMSKRYALTRRQARRYLRDRVLRDRLVVLSSMVLSHLRRGRTLEEIFGSVDAMKFRSSMELFASVTDDPWERSIFDEGRSA